MIEKIYILYLIAIVFFTNCSQKKTTSSIDIEKVQKIFDKVKSKDSGINFLNILKETDTLNYFTYPYLYMGGGISVGDINNDGLDDLFFTGNQVSNKLYLNKGDLKFEDITNIAGVGGDHRWYTGTTMADVNGDGLLDIYVLVAGQSENINFKQNELYINNGDLTFTESAVKYGLNDKGQSVSATFLDYDKDGDLDVYVANYPITPFNAGTYQYTQMMAHVQDIQSDQLYKNEGGQFSKVTEKAGVKQYNLSLSATAADINNDGWPDIYVSSDFNSPDALYINNRDGTFSDKIHDIVNHTAFYGMGVDIADFNNDTYLDIYQMDMDAASNRRSKANMASMNPEMFADIEKAGFKTQYMQNALQLQTGKGKDGLPIFSEISRLAGISSTDWSWGPLFADFDNDGWKDIFISNGTRREINNKDFFNSLVGHKKHKDSLLYNTLRIPSEPIDNYVFKNKGDLTFEKMNDQWGISHKGFSNGCVYADLDNDGDLEILTNNIDEEVSLFKNTTDSTKNYIQLSFKDIKGNRNGLGTKAYVYSGKKVQFQELTLTRGFQSSMAPYLHFGLGKENKIDSIKVIFSNGNVKLIDNISVNQRFTIYVKEADNKKVLLANQRSFFKSDTDSLAIYKHKENYYDDFKKEVLLPHKTSNFGPGISVGDLNGDGLDDFYIGAAKRYPAGMFYQNLDGSFTQQKTKVLVNDRNHEDLGSVIFDADNDGDNDIYIVSGGNEFNHDSELLQDRLYVNMGKGNFIKSPTSLPKMLSSGNRVYTNDFDKDGDLDLFIAGRLVPGNYPSPANSYILENVSTKSFIKFVDVTNKVAPFMNKLGMVTSASFNDIDNDGWDDLVVVGEWMPIKIFKNNKGKFSDVSKKYGLFDETTGWWFSIKSADFDADGDQDFIIGNLGLNYKYKADKEETFDIYFNDFDGNKKNDIVLSYYNEGKQYPVRGRQCSSQQIPAIKKKFKNYESFSTATLEDVYGDKLKNSLHYQIKSFGSIYMENTGGGFKLHQLPNQAQEAPINQILIKDYNNDGNLDALIAGNLYASEVETPRADAGIGGLLLGNGKGEFEYQDAFKTGFVARGDVKDMASIKIKKDNYILIAKNNDFMQIVKEK